MCKVKVSIKTVVADNENQFKLNEIDENSIVTTMPCVMAIDGSTTNTGVSILRSSDGAVSYVMAATREKNDETPVQYKVRLKRLMYGILLRNPMINTICYEEPFVGYETAAPNLFMLRTFIEEIIVEYEPTFNYIKHYEVNNMRWKKLFLMPDKCPAGTELQKAAVRKKLEGYLPFMSTVTQDEIDATCMGFTAIVMMKNGQEDDLKSKKKTKPFMYNIKFIGADDDDGMLQDLYDVYDGPEQLLQNGVLLTQIKGTANFDKKVYENMGSDDKVLIIKFSSNNFGNLILQYKIAALASSYDYLYAIVWRKSRK